MEIGAGSLKCVTTSSSGRPGSKTVETALQAHIRPEHTRKVFDNVFLVYTEADTATIRDWLEEIGAAFVVEFEQWSGYGARIDHPWLLERGH